MLGLGRGRAHLYYPEIKKVQAKNIGSIYIHYFAGMAQAD